jgi:23S rRNA (adenine-N6)-dimethyltransferase
VAERGRSARPRRDRSDGRHLLRSRTVAAELVREALVGPTDHVWEIGAGSGRLTAPLAERAGLVTAVERDPALAADLRRTFGRSGAVEVLCGDALRVPLPSAPYRAFGNIPFAITTPILRRLLDDPAGPLLRADLLIQLEVARKRAAVSPSTLLQLGWAPWWTFGLVRRVGRLGFEPPPTVDAGLLVVTRREPALLKTVDRPSYVRLVRRAFERSSWPVRRSLHESLPPLTWKRLARERGLEVDATPRDLDVFDWVAVSNVSGRPIPARAGSIPARGRRSP